MHISLVQHLFILSAQLVAFHSRANSQPWSLLCTGRQWGDMAKPQKQKLKKISHGCRQQKMSNTMKQPNSFYLQWLNILEFPRKLKFKRSFVLLLSCIQFCATPWSAACQVSLSFTISQSLLKFMSIESDTIQPFHPLSSPSPPAPNPSQHQGLFQ